MRTLLKKILLCDFKSFLLKTFHTLHHNQEFLDNWHISLISEYLQAVTNGKIKRLIINIPPRSLKSICVNVAWPAWLLANDPSRKIITASYSQALSAKHALDCRQIMNSHWYEENFPDARALRGHNTQSKFATAKNGFRIATSVGGTLTGEGADFLIVDDPLTPMQALSNYFRKRANIWFEQTLTSRLNSQKEGAIIIVMQRLHVKDLTGFLIEKDPENWQLLNIPLIAEKNELIQYNNFSYSRKAGEYLHNDRAGSKEIEHLKKALGSYAFAAQYQQNPRPLNGGIIKQSWLKYYDIEPKFETIYQSWDCAIKPSKTNDYTVCTTWGVYNSNYYLIDVLRERLDYPSLKKTIINNALNFKPNAVIVEDKASGQQIIQELTNNGLNIIKIMPKFDKLTRLIINSNIFESGRVFLPINKNWSVDFFSELLAFPNTNFDDQIDSTTQFLEWIENKKTTNCNYSVRKL